MQITKKWFFNKYSVAVLCTCMLGDFANANEKSVGGLQFLQPFNAQINNSIIKQRQESQKILKSSLSGKEFKIPSNWRLVSAVAAGKAGELVYVFQSSSGDVYTLSMDNFGAINPNELLHIPVQ